MKDKRWYILIVVVLMGALLLSACGGGGTTSTEPTAEQPEEPVVEEPTEAPAEEPTEAPAEEPTEAPAEEPTEAPAEEPTEAASEFDVSITIWADDTRAPILSQLAADFSAEYGVGLVVEQVADIRDQFKIAAPAGEGPDIIIIPHDQIGELVVSGLLAPVDLGAKADQFVPEAVQAFTYEGTLYGMPYATENLAFFRNTDLVPDPPATWDEVAQISQELLDAGSIEQGLALSGTTYDAFPLDTAFGGYIFGRDAEGNYDPADVGVDSEGMIAAQQWLDEQVEAGLVTDNPDWDTAHVLFENGQAPFIMAGPWALNRIRESGVPYAISAFPAGDAGPGQPFLGVQGFVINALSEDALLAQTFLTEFVATDETMQALFDADPRPSAWIPVREAIDDPDIAGFTEAGAGGLPMPTIPAMSAVWSSWNDAVVLILQQQQEPADALQTAGEQIRTLIEESQ